MSHMVISVDSERSGPQVLGGRSKGFGMKGVVPSEDADNGVDILAEDLTVRLRRRYDIRLVPTIYYSSLPGTFAL